ncbi:hypothetical protein [Streptomyces sp. NPDC097640]
MTVNLLTGALWATGLVANALCVGYALWLRAPHWGSVRREACGLARRDW